MEPAVQAQYTTDVRAAVADAVGVSSDSIRDLGGFESFVHEVDVAGTPRIVKATWGGRRTPDEIGAELHFVQYLADEGVSAARPVALPGGALQHPVGSDDGVFHVTCWAKAPGRSFARHELTPEMFAAWGALLGRMHQRSSVYPGSPLPMRRPTWQAELGSLATFMDDDPEALGRYRACLEAVGSLPRCPQSFGAMHTDPHHDNIFWHEGHPHIFDFDDMADFWFVSDLAIALYYAVLSVRPLADRQARFDTIRKQLLEGYGTEHALPAHAERALPLFLSLREQVLRAVMLRSVPEARRRPPQARFLKEARQRILAAAPPLGLRL